MAYCHECGSEVATIDVYCPYCGIFLKPAVEEKPEEENKPAPAVAETPETEKAEDIPAADGTDDFQPETETPKEIAPEEIAPEEITPEKIEPETEATLPKNEDFSLSATEEEIDLKDVQSESETQIPPAPIEPEIKVEEIEKAENLAENQQVDIVSETKESEPAETSKDEVDENEMPAPPVLVEENLPDVGSSVFEEKLEEKSETEIVEKTDEEVLEETPAVAEIEETPVNLSLPETPVEEIAESLAEEQKDPFIETFPDLSKAFTGEKEVEINLTPEAEKSETVSESAIEPVETPVTPEISMPAEDLETPVENASQSVFDSVRIIEKESSKAAQKVEESMPSPVVEEIAPTPLDETPVAEAIDSEKIENQKENRSYTTPNIGGSDTDGKKSAKLKPLDEGTILNGRYEIIRKIGGGGMGAVYLASDNNLGGVLRAVKEMVQSYIEETHQDKAIADFKRESMILSSLDHPSIPTIYDYFYDDKENRFYLVMKYISGGDLAGRLRAAPEGRLDEKTVTEWAIQISDVLDYLHNQPNTIVYRDLKPSNVMLDGNSARVMLIDFGIARSVNKEEKGVTAVGTMGYAPPELFSGNVEPRSDIYSLGSTMFHLLTGADPQSNPLLIFDFQKNPRPRQINSQLSDQMERILMRAVEYNASSRFATAAEMKKALEEHLLNLQAGRVTYGVGAVPVSVSLQDQPVFCGFCGQKIMATDMFCAFCGSKQPLSQKGVHSEIYSHAPVTAKLMVIGTNELDSPLFNIEKNENLLGRRDPMSNIFPEIDLSKFDPQTKISRRHALIRRDGNNFFLEDLGSSNGTIVIPAVSDSMRLLPHQPHILSNGDRIRVGDTTLHFVIN